jgi:hypothetical protein
VEFFGVDLPCDSWDIHAVNVFNNFIYGRDWHMFAFLLCLTHFNLSYVLIGILVWEIVAATLLNNDIVDEI